MVVFHSYVSLPEGTYLFGGSAGLGPETYLFISQWPTDTRRCAWKSIVFPLFPGIPLLFPSFPRMLPWESPFLWNFPVFCVSHLLSVGFCNDSSWSFQWLQDTPAIPWNFPIDLGSAEGLLLGGSLPNWQGDLCPGTGNPPFCTTPSAEEIFLSIFSISIISIATDK